jgi:hypothetical protein
MIKRPSIEKIKRQRRADIEKLRWVLSNFLERWIFSDFLEKEKCPDNPPELNQFLIDFQKNFLGRDPVPDFEKQLPWNMDTINTVHKLALLRYELTTQFWESFKKYLSNYRNSKEISPKLSGQKRDLLEFFFPKPTSIGTFITYRIFSEIDFSKELITLENKKKKGEVYYLVSLINGLPFSFFKKCDFEKCGKWFVSTDSRHKYCPGRNCRRRVNDRKAYMKKRKLKS